MKNTVDIAGRFWIMNVLYNLRDVNTGQSDRIHREDLILYQHMTITASSPTVHVFNS